MVNTPSQKLPGGRYSIRRRMVSAKTNSGGCHIADLPAHDNVTLTNHHWKLFWETLIFLQVTTISDITTACGSFFTQVAREVTQSYPSVFKWPCQWHHITQEHKLIICQILTASANHHYKLHQNFGAWITKPTTSRLYNQAGRVIYSGNVLGQWSSHSCIPRHCPL